MITFEDKINKCRMVLGTDYYHIIDRFKKRVIISIYFHAGYNMMETYLKDTKNDRSW